MYRITIEDRTAGHYVIPNGEIVTNDLDEYQVRRFVDALKEAGVLDNATLNVWQYDIDDDSVVLLSNHIHC